MSHDNDQKGIESCFMLMSIQEDQKTLNLLVWSCHVTMTKREKRHVKKPQFLLPESFVIFQRQKLFTSSNYQRAIYTRSLLHFCIFGQVNLYRLGGFWKRS